MDPLPDFLKWAEAQGISTHHGAKPQRLPGRGYGIVATKALKAGDLILTVPTSALRTRATVPQRNAALWRLAPRTLSAHGLLAADLAASWTNTTTKSGGGGARGGRDDGDDGGRCAAEPWTAVCPTADDLAAMPARWPAELRALLPGGAARRLRDQLAKLARDWAALVRSAAVPALLPGGREGEDAYRHAWLLVNTRTFYYEPSSSSSSAARSARPGGRGPAAAAATGGRDDKLALVPVADLFNHGPTDGCAVSFGGGGGGGGGGGMTVRADRAYGAGEELRLCYGRHGGDVLAVEYGFALGRDGDGDGDANGWDEVSLDDEVMLPRLDDAQRADLARAGFLGGYVLDRETVCHRTQVAVRRALDPDPDRWSAFVRGLDDGSSGQAAVDGWLVAALADYAVLIGRRIAEVRRLEVGTEQQRALLARRWRQIGDIVRVTLERLRAD